MRKFFFLINVALLIFFSSSLYINKGLLDEKREAYHDELNTYSNLRPYNNNETGIDLGLIIKDFKIDQLVFYKNDIPVLSMTYGWNMDTISTYAKPENCIIYIPEGHTDADYIKGLQSLGFLGYYVTNDNYHVADSIFNDYMRKELRYLLSTTYVTSQSKTYLTGFNFDSQYNVNYLHLKYTGVEIPEIEDGNLSKESILKSIAPSQIYNYEDFVNCFEDNLEQKDFANELIINQIDNSLEALNDTLRIADYYDAKENNPIYKEFYDIKNKCTLFTFLLCLSIILLVLNFILWLVFWSEQRKKKKLELEKQSNYLYYTKLKNKFPFAVKQKEKLYRDFSEYDRIKKILEIDENILRKEQEDEDVRLQIKEREYKRIKSLDDKVKKDYPNGYKLWAIGGTMKAMAYGRDIWEIYKHEKEIKELECCYNEQIDTEQFANNHIDFPLFTDYFQTVIKNLKYDWINFDLEYQTIKEKEDSVMVWAAWIATNEKPRPSSITVPYISCTKACVKIMHITEFKYCLSKNIDYSFLPDLKRNTEYVKKLWSQKEQIDKHRYNPIFNLLQSINAKDVLFVFCGNGMSQKLKKFSNLKNISWAEFNCRNLDVLKKDIRAISLDFNLHYEYIDMYDEMDDDIFIKEELQQDWKYVIFYEIITPMNAPNHNIRRVYNIMPSHNVRFLYYSQYSEISYDTAKQLEEKERKKFEEDKIIKRNKQLSLHTKEYKKEKNQILELLNEKGIYYFYHFTDRKNIPSIIKQGGLFSWDFCQNNDICIENPGGDEFSRKLDRRFTLQDYVRLSFCNDHPMAYRKKQEGSDIVLLKIAIDVATFESTIFSDINATDSTHKQGKSLKFLQTIDFEAVKANYVSRDDEMFKYHQAEVMVKTFLPIQYIVNINKIKL